MGESEEDNCLSCLLLVISSLCLIHEEQKINLFLLCGPSLHIATISLLQQWGKASLLVPRGPIQTPVPPSLLQQHAMMFLGQRRKHRSVLVMMMADVSPFLPSILCYPHSLLLCACQSMPGPVLQLWCCCSPD